MAAYSSTKHYGPPTTGQFDVGDTFTDASSIVYVCVVAGFPGQWVAQV